MSADVEELRGLQNQMFMPRSFGIFQGLTKPSAVTSINARPPGTELESTTSQDG